MNTHQTQNHLSKWLPSRGNVIFNLLMISALLWVQSASAITGLTSAALTTSSTNIINYQGYLTDNDGNPITDNVDMTFRVYNTATGGTSLWQETWSGASSIPVSGGVFNVALGDIDTTLTQIAQGQSNLYLGITIDSSPELAPRTKFGSAFNAMQAPVLAESITSAALVDGGVMAIDLASGSVTTGKLANSSVTSTQLLNGSVMAVDLASNSVTTEKLADSSVYTAKLANGSVTNAKLADNSVASAQLANGSVTEAKVSDAVLERYPFHAYSSVNTTISSDTTVTFIETVDPENVFSNNQFVAPRAGYYSFDTTISFDGGNGSDDTIDFSYAHNGNLVNTLRINPRYSTATGAEVTESNSVILYLNTNDTVSVRITSIGTNIRLKTRTLSGFYLGQ